MHLAAFFFSCQADEVPLGPSSPGKIPSPLPVLPLVDEKLDNAVTTLTASIEAAAGVADEALEKINAFKNPAGRWMRSMPFSRPAHGLTPLPLFSNAQ